MPTTCLPYIRWAILRDIPALMLVDNEAYQHPLIRSDWVELLTKHSHLITLVAEVDGVVLGYANYMITHHALWLERMAVHSSVRRRGIGRELMSRLQRRIDAGRRKRCAVLVTDEASDLLDFFRSCGWKASRMYRPMQPCDGTASVVEFSYHARDVGALVIDSILNGSAKVVR